MSLSNKNTTLTKLKKLCSQQENGKLTQKLGDAGEKGLDFTERKDLLEGI